MNNLNNLNIVFYGDDETNAKFKRMMEDYLESDHNKLHHEIVSRIASSGIKLIEVNKMLLPVIAELKGQEVTYDYKGTISTGRIISVKDNIVRLRDKYHRRRLNISNIIIYHPAVIALIRSL